MAKLHWTQTPEGKKKLEARSRKWKKQRALKAHYSPPQDPDVSNSPLWDALQNAADTLSRPTLAELALLADSPSFLASLRQLHRLTALALRLAESSEE